MKFERIARLRELMNIGQSELAEKIGVSKQTLYKYENGIVSNVPSDKIEAMAKIFGVTPAYLMGWEDSPTPEQTPVPNPDQLSSDEKTLVTNYRILDSTDRMKAQGYIEGLALDEKYQKKKREGSA